VTTVDQGTIEGFDDQAFHVEQRGIDFVPENQRWATARNIGALWAGSALNVEYFIYGALLMGFGFSFPVALSLIVIGNLSFLLLGLASLQGPETGTTAFTITRAAFGTRGSRIMSFFNWITQLGFETEGLILIVGAAVVLSQLAGVHVNNTLKIAFVVVAVVVATVGAVAVAATALPVWVTAASPPIRAVAAAATVAVTAVSRLTRRRFRSRRSIVSRLLILRHLSSHV